jgi:hypothetical protein
MRRFVVSMAWALLAVGLVEAGSAPPLPGPALELPVDVDGDGVATWGDSYAFNLWLEAGGKLKLALSAGEPKGGFLDLSEFFHSPQAALSKDAAILKWNGGLDGGGGVALLGIEDCPSGGFLEGVFDQGVTQVFTIACDDTLLANANAQAIRTLDESIYVTRRVADSDGGVTRLQGISVEGDGRLSAVILTNVVSNICMASKLAYDAPRDDFLLTVNTFQGGFCGGADGAVKRLKNLDNQPITVCEELNPQSGVTIARPEGIGVFKQAAVCEAQIGDVAVSNNRVFDFDENKSGNVRLMLNQDCPATPGGRIIHRFLHSPSGLDIGNFNNAPGAEFGIYVGTARRLSLVDPTQTIEEPRITRLVAELAGVCSWDNQGDTIHAVLPTNPDSVVFDRFTSTSLFVTLNSGQIMIVRPQSGQGPVAFASNFDFRFGSGISFPHSGIMLVSELNQVVAVDGWRFRFRRGDANSDNLPLSVSDGAFISNWLFSGGPEPTCWDAADADDNSRLNISDAIFIFNFVSNGGPPPPDPGPDDALGVDPTEDLFGCRQYHVNGRIVF